MPNYTYYTLFSSETIWDGMPDTNIYPQNDALMQQMYEDYVASQQKEKDLEEDKRKYPLFFWREVCAEHTLKEGIV